jgi:hypothetical protein
MNCLMIFIAIYIYIYIYIYIFYNVYQAQLYTILELCRIFDQIFKEHLDGG